MRADLKAGLRQLARAPAVTIAAVITLAIGIGATAAVLSFVAAVMSAASPAPDMDRLVAIWSHDRSQTEAKGLVSAADFLEWKTRAHAFERMAAMRTAAFNMSGAGDAVRVAASLVTPDYTSVLGWQPMIGRTFTAEDAQPGAARVVLVSHTFWRTRLASRPDVVGATVRLDAEPSTIVGVLPPSPASTGIFVPLSLEALRDDRHARTLFVWARLGAGVSIERARQEMSAIGEALEREYPATNRGWSVNTQPLQDEFVGPQARLIFGLLVVIVIIVLLISCANIANLLIVRGAARRGEMALRLALGASGHRLVRQLLVECGVLAAAGGALSLIVSRATLDLLSALGAIESPWLANSGVNPRGLALTFVLTMAATLLAGLWPALAARRTDLRDGLHTTGRGSTGAIPRVMRTLVGTQVAMAVTLLVVAGLATRTLHALESLEPGFEMDNVLTASVTLPEARPLASAAQWFAGAVAHARRLPGVTTAGAASRLPFAGSRWNPNQQLEIEGRNPAGEPAPFAIDYVVTPGYLESLRVPLVDGRLLTDADAATTRPVAVVNETMARRYWPARSPVGARLRQSPQHDWATVVGVVGDIRNDDADAPPLPYLYVPLAQRPVRTMSLTLRSAGDPRQLVAPLRGAIAAFDPDQALYDVQTMRAIWEQDLAQSRLLVYVMDALSVVALALAGIGLWGVAAQSAARRTREIGLRVALGATSAQVGALVVRHSVMPMLGGLIGGLTAGLALGRLMRSILFDVSPADPLTVTATVALLLIVGLLAGLVPALRAARVDPLAALRAE
jgi:predicted permease